MIKKGSVVQWQGKDRKLTGKVIAESGQRWKIESGGKQYFVPKDKVERGYNRKPKEETAKKAEPKKAEPKKKGGVVSLDFLKELSQKKGFSFDPEVAFKSLKVGHKMFLRYEGGDKAVEIVSSDEKGITFNEYDYKLKTTQLHSGPNTVEDPSTYTQTILGDKKKKKLKLTWSQFYWAGRKSKNTPNGAYSLTTYPYSEYWERRRKNPPSSSKKSILD